MFDICSLGYFTDALKVKFFLYVPHKMKVSMMCCCNSLKVVEIRVTYIIPFANKTKM